VARAQTPESKKRNHKDWAKCFIPFVQAANMERAFQAVHKWRWLYFKT
jgi:hypothetical protein